MNKRNAMRNDLSRPWLLLVTGLWVVTGALWAQEAGPATGATVPDGVIMGLRARYVTKDDKEAGLSETEKLRRYQVILREGAWTERQYPVATNLYLVQEVMLAAARDAAFLNPSDQAEKTILEIAQRLVASPAPVTSRMFADLVVSRQELDKFAGQPAKQLEVVRGFLARYTDPAVEARALLLSLDLFDLVNSSDAERLGKAGNRLPGEVLDMLQRKYAYDPVVFEYLIGRGVHPFSWRAVKGRLKLADGSTLVLPRDVLGRVAVFNVWQTGKNGWSQNLARWPTMTNSIADLQGRYEYGMPFYSQASLAANGVQFYGLNVDDDPATWKLGLKALNLPWIQTYGDPGSGNPLGRMLQVRTPSVFMLLPDGLQFRDSLSDGSRGGGAVGNIGAADWLVDGNPLYAASMAGRVAPPVYEYSLRVRYYRAGEFLLDEPAVFPVAAPGPDDVPAERLEVIRQIVARSPWNYYTPPTNNLVWISHVRLATAEAEGEAKANALRQALTLGRAIEKEYPRAGDLTRVRNWMLVAARWLANERLDRDADRQSLQLAQAILDAKPPAGQALFAEYVQLSDQLAKNDTNAVPRITAFAKPYAATGLNWMADLFAYVLLLECGEYQGQLNLGTELIARYPKPTPKMRGGMRDFCRLTLDAKVTQYGLLWWGNQHRGVKHALQSQAITAELPLLKGGTLRLPATGKKMVALHFWTIAAPPRWTTKVHGRLVDLADDVAPSNDRLIIGINLDQDRAAVQAYLQQRPDLKDWVHVFSGQGWRDPLARELDIYGLPRSAVLSLTGTIERWGYPGEPDRF